MKSLLFYEKNLSCFNSEQVFQYFMKSLKETIKSWDFFVDWKKINSKISSIEISLHLLNSLIGKNDIESNFKILISKYPEISNVLPILIAIREKSIKILDPIDTNIFNFNEYSFDSKQKLDDIQIEKLTEFCNKSGIFNIFKNNKITNLVDYVSGLEVGLDSNARKNRTGNAMEAIIELFLKNFCVKNGFSYISQATATKIKSNFGYKIEVDKSERSFDFAIDTGNNLFLIETNYYGGGGSKLKSVAGEFTSLSAFIKERTPEHEFIWITDGKGWETANKPLKEAFLRLDYIINLEMMEKGILEYIIKKGE